MSIKFTYLTAFLLLPVFFVSGLASAGIVYKKSFSNELIFVENISIGKDQVCAYIGDLTLEEGDQEVFIPETKLRQETRRRATVIERWERIIKSENMLTFGPFDPIELYSSLLGESAPNRVDRIIGGGLMGIGGFTSFALAPWLYFQKRILMDKASQYFGYVNLLKNAAQNVDAKSASVEEIWRAIYKADLGDLTTQILEKGFNDPNFIKSQLYGTLLDISPQIFTVGLGITGLGFLFYTLQENLFSPHKIKSLLSNTMVVEDRILPINKLKEVIAEVPENLVLDCPPPEKVLKDLKSNIFDYYRFNMSDFPEEKFNLNVILDRILKKVFAF